MGIILGDENNVICAIFWVPYDHSFLMRKNFVNCHRGYIRNINETITCWSIQWSFKYANIDWLGVQATEMLPNTFFLRSLQCLTQKQTHPTLKQLCLV